VLQRPALERPVAERDLAADRRRRRKRDDLGDGKAPLGEDPEHFAADVACRADDRDLET
jgi:hypothetical protein